MLHQNIDLGDNMKKKVVRKPKRQTKLGAFGSKDGSQRGLKKGGLGRNRVSLGSCRHINIRKGR